MRMPLLRETARSGVALAAPLTILGSGTPGRIFPKPARQAARRPKVIICYTTMGKGVPLIEEREKAHFVKVEHYEWELALAQLEGRRG